MCDFGKIITKSCRLTAKHAKKLKAILKSRNITFSQYVRSKIENERDSK